MMPDSFTGAEAGDLRFQFEVIKNLAESVRQISTSMADVQRTQVGMLERLAKIESNRVNEDVARLDARVEVVWNKVDKLEQSEDRREGASRFTRAVITWWPVIGVAFTVLFLLFRATGIIHMPQDPAVQPAAPYQAPPQQPKVSGP